MNSIANRTFKVMTVVAAFVCLTTNFVCSVQRTDAQSIHTGKVTRSFAEPIQTSVVASPEVGVVKTAVVKEGDRVRIGDRLAILNHDVLVEALRIAVARSESTAKRDAAAARAKMLKGQKETLEGLISGGHVNQYELEQKTTEYQTAVAEQRSAEDEIRLNKIEVDRIKAQIEQRIIKSPIDGFVTHIHKQPGEHVSTTEPQFATVVRVDQLKVRFYLNEKTLDQFSVGHTVPILVGKHGSMRSAREREATVTFVSPVIDADSGTGRLDVLLDNQDFAIRSGSVCSWVAE